MEDPPPNPTRPQVVGRALTFLLVPTGSPVKLGPAWGVLCGALAAGNWRWEGETLLKLALTLFIAEALWSTWRALLVDTDWKGMLATHPLPARGDPLPRLPYTTPWSPLGRVLGWWGRMRRWARESPVAERRGALMTLPLLPPLILLLSVVTGWQTLLLSLAALSLSLLEWLAARRGQTHKALQAMAEIGLSWLAGHIVFGPLTPTSFVLACCYALAYQGAITLSDDRRSWSLALLYGGQAAALLVLILHEHPRATLASIVASVLLVPQLLLLARLGEGEQSMWYLVRAMPFLMIAMPLVAWAT